MKKEMEKEREKKKGREKRTPLPRGERKERTGGKKKSPYLEECAQEVHNTEHFWRAWWERAPLSLPYSLAPVFSRALLWIAAGRLHMLALTQPVAILDGT